MKILHIGKFFPPHMGGMEVYLEDLITAQRQRGKDARAVVHGQPLASDPSWLVRVPVAATLLFTPLAPRFRKVLRHQLRTFCPDVLHIHLPNPSAFLLLSLPEARQVPWVLHWHADVVTTVLQGRLALAYRVYRPLEQAMLAAAEQVIVTSPDYLEASAPLSEWRGKCSVVPLGIDEARLHCAGELQASEGVASIWQPGYLRVLSIGRLTYYKGFETLMKAVAGVANMQLVIVGTGEEQVQLSALQARLQSAGGGRPHHLVGRGQ